MAPAVVAVDGTMTCVVSGVDSRPHWMTSTGPEPHSMHSRLSTYNDIDYGTPISAPVNFVL